MEQQESLQEQVRKLKEQLEKSQKEKELLIEQQKKRQEEQRRKEEEQKNGSFKQYFMQPTCDKIGQIIEVLNGIDAKMTKIFDTLVQKGEKLKEYDISQQMNLEWDIIEERKANVLAKKAEVDKLIIIIETLLQCISLLLGKAQEILERGSATEEDDKILKLLQEEIERFVKECKKNGQKKKNNNNLDQIKLVEEEIQEDQFQDKETKISLSQDQDENDEDQKVDNFPDLLESKEDKEDYYYDNDDDQEDLILDNQENQENINLIHNDDENNQTQ